MLLAAQGLLAARARRCAADLPASDGATSCSAQKSCRRKRLQGHRQRSRCSPRDLMHRRRLVMCSVPSCVAVVLLTGLSSRAARDGVLGRSSDRRPRTGGARREHRHACGARRDARRRARRGRRGRLALGVGTRRRTCARARARAHAHAPRSTPLRCAIGNEESIECPLPGPAARRARACGRAREDWCKRREMLVCGDRTRPTKINAKRRFTKDT